MKTYTYQPKAGMLIELDDTIDDSALNRKVYTNIIGSRATALGKDCYLVALIPEGHKDGDPLMMFEGTPEHMTYRDTKPQKDAVEELYFRANQSMLAIFSGVLSKEV